MVDQVSKLTKLIKVSKKRSRNEGSIDGEARSGEKICSDLNLR